MNIPQKPEEKKDKRIFCTECQLRLDNSPIERLFNKKPAVDGIEFKDGWKCLKCFEKVK